MKIHIQFGLSIMLTLLLVSCNNETNKGHDIYWDNDNLCVVMEHPTYGIVEINRPNWGKVSLNEVVEDIYDYIRKNEYYETVEVWVRFESPLTDKYGNETMTYEDYEIATIPVYEAKKYKSWEFLNQSYNIITNIEKAAFGDINERIEEVVEYNNDNGGYDLGEDIEYNYNPVEIYDLDSYDL